MIRSLLSRNSDNRLHPEALFQGLLSDSCGFKTSLAFPATLTKHTDGGFALRIYLSLCGHCPWSVSWPLPSNQSSLIPYKHTNTHRHIHSLKHRCTQSYMHTSTGSHLEIAFNRQGDWETTRFIFRHVSWGIAGHTRAEPFSLASSAHLARVFQAVTAVFSFKRQLNGTNYCRWFLLDHLGFENCHTDPFFSKAISGARLAGFKSWFCHISAVGTLLSLSVPQFPSCSNQDNSCISWQCGGEDNMN